MTINNSNSSSNINSDSNKELCYVDVDP